MDYKKKYEDALKRAKDVHTYYCDDREQLRKIESIFPELTESKDERIRNVIRGRLYTQPDSFFDNEISKEEMFACLEKQGDQESIDNIKQKFHVGDWITFYGSKPFKILKVESEQNGILDYLLLEPSGHYTYYNKKYVDENARLWT